MEHKVKSDKLWKVEDVAAYLSVSKTWVYNVVAEGTIPGRKLPTGPWRFDPKEIEEWYKNLPGTEAILQTQN